MGADNPNTPSENRRPKPRRIGAHTRPLEPLGLNRTAALADKLRLQLLEPSAGNSGSSMPYFQREVTFDFAPGSRRPRGGARSCRRMLNKHLRGVQPGKAVNSAGLKSSKNQRGTAPQALLSKEPVEKLGVEELCKRARPGNPPSGWVAGHKSHKIRGGL